MICNFVHIAASATIPNIPSHTTPTPTEIWAANAPSTQHHSPLSSPTRTALHNVFKQRQKHHFKSNFPHVLPNVRQYPTTVVSSPPRPVQRHFSQQHPLSTQLSGVSMGHPEAGVTMARRSESIPGVSLLQPNHRRVRKLSVQQQQDMQWEMKSRPKRKH